MKSFGSRFVAILSLIACAVVTCSNEVAAQTPSEFNSAVAKYSTNGPAGGPGKNPNAAVFVFFRAANEPCWVADGSIVSVEIQPTNEPNDTKQGGPTPVGEYLIGQRYKHEHHQIDWYKLYPRIEDGSGYYGDTAKTNAGRFAMGLHPGSVSLGCVTVKSMNSPHDAAAAWRSVRSKLDSSKLNYKNDEFSGFLSVENK